MAVTTDALSLPIAVAESDRELARMLGRSLQTVRSGICRGRRRKHPKYVVVEVEDDAVF